MVSRTWEPSMDPRCGLTHLQHWAVRMQPRESRLRQGREGVARVSVPALVCRAWVVSIPLQASIPVLEHPHGSLMICPCIYREFPLS